MAGFEELTLGTAGYENGVGLAGSGFTSGGLTFNNNYDAAWGSWDGWAYSNMTDTTTPGYDEPIQRHHRRRTGRNGDLRQWPTAASPPSRPSPRRQNTLFQTAYLTNTTYAYLSMRDGDAVGKKFGGASGTDPDWFKLTVTGRNAAQVVVGSIDVYLADFRPAAERSDNPVKENYILNQWSKVDLAGLGNTVRSLSLSFASTDNDETWGMNTPAYVAFDALTAVSADQVTLPPDVQNAAALNLAGGVRELGHITGGGTLSVQAGTTLVADSIVQDTLVIGAGGAVVIRETGGQGASAVPEPGLLALLLGGGLVMAGLWRRRKSLGR